MTVTTPYMRRQVYIDSLQFELSLMAPDLEGAQDRWISFPYEGLGAAAMKRPAIRFRRRSPRVLIGTSVSGNVTRVATNTAQMMRGLFPAQVHLAQGSVQQTASLLDNTLSPAERLALHRLRGDTSPVEFVAAVVAGLVPHLYKAAEARVREVFADMALGSSRQSRSCYIRRIPPKLRRVEFFIDVQQGLDTRPTIAAVEAAITQGFGHFDEFGTYNRVSTRTGLLRRWRLDRRRGEAEPPRVNRGAISTIKIYEKDGRVRIEVGADLPAAKEGSTPVSIYEQIMAAAREHLPILAEIDRLLDDAPVVVPPDELLAALVKVGVRKPSKRTEYLELVRQLSTYGVYDPRKARHNGGQNLRYASLKRTAANPDYGLLVREPRMAVGGTSIEPVYKLHHDWRARAERAESVRTAVARDQDALALRNPQSSSAAEGITL